ncbi:hypothetical protein R3P38DRAFT_59170 [Favolaschia claudopus]|uniref:Secreted protein n=1 Tax=Favolaschia claudopus TaxID=2862362 RepID=A0AAW0EHX0_9AGAR
MSASAACLYNSNICILLIANLVFCYHLYSLYWCSLEFVSSGVCEVALHELTGSSEYLGSQSRLPYEGSSEPRSCTRPCTFVLKWRYRTALRGSFPYLCTQLSQDAMRVHVSQKTQDTSPHRVRGRDSAYVVPIVMTVPRKTGKLFL